MALTKIIPDKEKRIRLIQDLKKCITNNNGTVVILHGNGNNGKTVLLHTLMVITGNLTLCSSCSKLTLTRVKHLNAWLDDAIHKGHKCVIINDPDEYDIDMYREMSKKINVIVESNMDPPTENIENVNIHKFDVVFTDNPRKGNECQKKILSEYEMDEEAKILQSLFDLF